jgi:flagellar basal-body rod modification protein FlgD
LGRDDFLKLFLAQMNHQDPLNPMDSTQFSAQLAQFSSLEQLFNVNENLEGIQTAQNEVGRFQSLALIGKEIEAEGDRISLKPGLASKGSFNLESRAECRVLIKDPQGYPIRELKLGELNSGPRSFEWDGNDGEGNRMDPGVYGFEVVPVDEYGQIVPVETRIRGLVDRISLEGGSQLLYIGDMALDLSQVVDIGIPKPAAGDPSE